jgi:hypothetical protein
MHSQQNVIPTLPAKSTNKYIHHIATHCTPLHPSQNKRQRVRKERKRKTKQNKTKHNSNNNNNRDIKIDRGWEMTQNGSQMHDTNRNAWIYSAFGKSLCT